MPFFWSQTQTSFTDFQPDIVIDKIKDQKNLCTKRHFAKLFQKYSRNIICLNLTKQNAREGPLSMEYEYFVNRILNKDLPSSLKTIYIHYDVKANQKARKRMKDADL